MDLRHLLSEPFWLLFVISSLSSCSLLSCPLSVSLRWQLPFKELPQVVSQELRLSVGVIWQAQLWLVRLKFAQPWQIQL